MTGEGSDDDWETGPWSFGGLLWERRLRGLIKRLSHRPQPRGLLLMVLVGVPLAVLVVVLVASVASAFDL